MTYVIVSVSAAACAASGVLWYRTRDRAANERAAAALAPAAAAILALAALAAFGASFFHSWNGARLAPAAALLRGYRLYYPVNEGPILGMMYTPVAALAYVPAVLARTPFLAVAIGELMTMAYFFVPLWWCVYARGRRGDAGRSLAWLCGLSAALFSVCVKPLSGPAFWIHADAPCLCFGAAACGVLYFRRPAAAIPRYLLSAAAAMLAILSKQVAVPLVAALPAICAIYEGRRACLQYLACLAGVTAATAAALCVTVDVKAMWLNAITLPKAHPWTGPGAKVLTAAAGELALYALLPLAVLGICGAAGRMLSPPDRRGLPAWIEDHRWLMWVLVAAMMVPTSLMGRAKIGGAENTLANTLYFVVIAAALAVIRTVERAEETQAPRATARCRMMMIAITAALALAAAPKLAEIPKWAGHIRTNPEIAGFRFACAHPGTYHFPFHPLMSLMSEGKAYHFADGVYCRYLADIEVSPAHVREFLPERMRFVAFVGARNPGLMYLPPLPEPITVPELPGWSVYPVPEAPGGNE